MARLLASTRCLIFLSNYTVKDSLIACTLNRRNFSDVPSSMVGRDFLTLKNYSQSEIQTLLWTSLDLKTRIKTNKEHFRPLVGKSISMIFQKRSTRTRLSTETGMSLLGGKACFLSPDDVHLGVNESVKDTAKVLSGFNDLILGRVYGQSDLDILATEASVPIISGLSDLYHPLQMLADLMTIQEHFGRIKGLKLAYIGDGNNIIHSILMGGAKMGLDIRVATPKVPRILRSCHFDKDTQTEKHYHELIMLYTAWRDEDKLLGNAETYQERYLQGYECDPMVTRDAINFATHFGTELKITNDPMEAVRGVDIIVTDTWVSMGQEEEKALRLKHFAGYQVDRKMVSMAAPGWIFMHCLPRKGQEVTDDIFYCNNSVVWQEAENRMWTVMAVMLHLLQDHVPTIPKPAY